MEPAGFPRKTVFAVKLPLLVLGWKVSGRGRFKGLGSSPFGPAGLTPYPHPLCLCDFLQRTLGDALGRGGQGALACPREQSV